MPQPSEPTTKEGRDGILAAVERLQARGGNLSSEVMVIHLKQVHAQVDALEAENKRLRYELTGVDKATDEVKRRFP